MTRVWQGCIFFFASIVVCTADEAHYVEPVIQKVVLDEDFGMLDRERDEYATNLSIYIGNYLAAKEKPVQLDYDLTRKVISLALHLSARNKRTMVLNYQLRKGLPPQKLETEYDSSVLARLLLTRAELLFKQKGEENRYIARCFVELAATLDPRNEDAVYAYEIQRIDYGALNWKPLTDAVRDEKVPEKIEEKEPEKKENVKK